MWTLMKAGKNSKKAPKCIGVLTSGGDAPGMNAAIRAVVRTALYHGIDVFGIYRGYAGLLNREIQPMTAASCANIIQRGGTILRTSRSEEFRTKAGRKKAAQILADFGIDALAVIGGDGSFRGAQYLWEEHEIRTVGIPGTIDNDIPGTEDTIGFDTAMNTAIELIDKIRDTASAHDRIFLIEVMGRHSGQIALHTGLGAGAETIVLPEHTASLERITQIIDRGQNRGKNSSILVVSEGCAYGGAQALADLLVKKGYDPRVAILGHTQRGGSPSAHDRILASTLGSQAVVALLNGASAGFVGISAGKVVLHKMDKSTKKEKPDFDPLLEVAQWLSI
jgi:6-phosphofructokinase 1